MECRDGKSSFSTIDEQIFNLLVSAEAMQALGISVDWIFFLEMQNETLPLERHWQSLKNSYKDGRTRT